MTRPDPDLVVDVHLGPDDIDTALRDDVRRGLTSASKVLPPKWFYDDRGSDLFDQITRLPEYYPTRCEAEILEREAKAIAVGAGADTLIELGSGTSEKTLHLLDAFAAAGQLRRFVPFDVSEATLRNAAVRINERYPGLAVHAVVGDFDHHLPFIPEGGNRLVAFLGGTIGNLDPAGRDRFLRTVADLLEPGEHLLLGTDLVKEPDRLIAAYDDADGVTAEFNRNVLHVINRELDADFDVDRFAHEARWNADEERIEMWLRADEAMRVRVEALDLDVGLERGEAMCTELSCKFTPSRIEDELGAAGFEISSLWTDEADDFALTLARRH